MRQRKGSRWKVRGHRLSCPDVSLSDKTNRWKFNNRSVLWIHVRAVINRIGKDFVAATFVFPHQSPQAKPKALYPKAYLSQPRLQCKGQKPGHMRILTVCLPGLNTFEPTGRGLWRGALLYDRGMTQPVQQPILESAATYLMPAHKPESPLKTG